MQFYSKFNHFRCEKYRYYTGIPVFFFLQIPVFFQKPIFFVTIFNLVIISLILKIPVFFFNTGFVKIPVFH